MSAYFDGSSIVIAPIDDGRAVHDVREAVKGPAVVTECDRKCADSFITGVKVQ